MTHKRFHLVRDEDVSGVSGIGVVAEGVQFSDGRIAFRWLTDRRTTVLADSIADILAIHGHGGRTRIVWLDTPDTPPSPPLPPVASRSPGVLPSGPESAAEVIARLRGTRPTPALALVQGDDQEAPA